MTPLDSAVSKLSKAMERGSLDRRGVRLTDEEALVLYAAVYDLWAQGDTDADS